MTIIWKEVTLEDQNLWNQVMELYDRSFPLEVREPHSIFKKSMKYAEISKPNAFHFIAGIDNEQVVSFATGHYLAEVNAGFIVYIATNPSVQNKGLGSHTLLTLEQLLNKDAIKAGYSSLNLVILETEKEENAETKQEQEECQKRKSFFERNKYKAYKEIEYVQPPLYQEHEAVPLNLLIKNVQKIDITIEYIFQIVKYMYQEKYLAVNGLEKETIIGCLQNMGLE